MKFITEMELRGLYKAEPFTTYVLETNTKITPEARQFLVDRGIKLAQVQCGAGKKSNTNALNRTQGRENWCVLRLRGRMECIESLFWLVGAELFGRDVVLAEEVMALGKYFRDVQKAEREQTAPDNFEFWGWSEEEINKFSNSVGIRIDIGELHVRLANGKEIALLNHLRAALREVKSALWETYWHEDKQTCSRADLIDKVDMIINILCIIIWKCLGGQQCKR